MKILLIPGPEHQALIETGKYGARNPTIRHPGAGWSDCADCGGHGRVAVGEYSTEKCSSEGCERGMKAGRCLVLLDDDGPVQMGLAAASRTRPDLSPVDHKWVNMVDGGVKGKATFLQNRFGAVGHVFVDEKD